MPLVSRISAWYKYTAPDHIRAGIYKTEGLTADDLLFGIVFRT